MSILSPLPAPSPTLIRVAVYIDRFNLYHAIDDLKISKLKWLNIAALGRQFLRENETLAKCHYFSTIVDWDAGKKERHESYVAALEAKGVMVTLGNFKRSDRHCSRTGNRCPFREEKQTDVSIGVNIVADALMDVFDRLVLVTADTDQIPTLKMVKSLKPEKAITWAAPPGKMRQAREIGDLVPDRFEITAGQIGSCRLPRVVMDANDRIISSMPSSYL